ncbi:MAG: TetR/AcrR family transcriptional regulator C-terminal domain-containing protein [Halioglobus sp.]|nr:TetR/AcrR family transcriptional regulator C-terminal domain-containing protein [Halioglobus sp.]
MAKPLVAVETIYDAALELLDESGPDALSARNLAARLKCSTRTLYQQVGKREELIGRLIDYQLDRLKLDFHRGDHWRDSARNWALGMREALLAHPNLSSLMTTEHRAPVASYANELLKVLLEAGFEQEHALRACRVLVNVAVSLALSEIKTPPIQHVRRNRSAREIAFEDLIITRTGRDREHFQDPPEVFRCTIDWLLGGIEAERAAGGQ